MRLIDADVLLKRAEESFKNAGLHGEDYRKFKKWLRKAPTVSEWIPCSERLPKEDAGYLVQLNYGIVDVLRWANILEKVDDYDFYNKKHGGWYEYDGEWGYCERNEVVAWIPLPEPWKGGGHGR